MATGREKNHEEHERARQILLDAFRSLLTNHEWPVLQPSAKRLRDEVESLCATRGITAPTESYTTAQLDELVKDDLVRVDTAGSKKLYRLNTPGNTDVDIVVAAQTKQAAILKKNKWLTDQLETAEVVAENPTRVTISVRELMEIVGELGRKME